jgi:Zn-dependent protease
MTTHALRLGRIGGIEVAVHWSWLIVFTLVTWSLATTFFPGSFSDWSPFTYWIVAAVSALLLFGSLLAHELAHSFVARAEGIPVQDITLFMFGGVSNITQEPASARDEFRMAVIGPVTSLLIGGLAGAVLVGVGGGLPSELQGILLALAFYNIGVAAFNLLPGFPLDGGRLLRAGIWRFTGNFQRATRIATTGGHVVAYVFVFAGVFLAITGEFLNGVWLIFIGWFLNSGADISQRQVELEASLGDVRVRALMRPISTKVPAQMTLLEFVDEFVLGRNQRAVPVVSSEGILIGVITLDDLRAIARGKWAVTTVGQIARPLDRFPIIRPDEPLLTALGELSADGVDQVPVVDHGDLVGLLTRADIMRYLQDSSTMRGSRRPQK